MNNSKIKCLLTRKFWDRDIKYLQERVDPCVEFVCPDRFEVDRLIELITGDIKIALGEPPPKEVLDAATSLELLQIPWTGVEKLDFEVLKKYNIPVCNSHGNATALAEMAVALMFSALKQIPSHDAALRNGNWRRPGASDCTFPDRVFGKTVGLIGFGATGKRIFEMLCGFKAKFIIVASEPRMENGLTVFDVGCLDELCQQSDIIFVVVPLTPATQGMITSQHFFAMKPSACFINVARGGVVEEKALFDALKGGSIGSAGIDVWYQYPKSGKSFSSVSKYPFHELDNLVMSPHRGGMINNELPHLIDVVENLNRFASGAPLINQINLLEGY